MSETPPQNSADILVIDDNIHDSILIQEAFKNTLITAEIHILNEAKKALDYLNKKGEFENATTPNLILLDLKMPEFNGYEFLRVIKSDPAFSHIPVIILTTSSDKKDIQRCYKNGANCYITKPVNFAKFKQIVSVINDFWLGISSLPDNNDAA